MHIDWHIKEKWLAKHNFIIIHLHFNKIIIYANKLKMHFAKFENYYKKNRNYHFTTNIIILNNNLSAKIIILCGFMHSEYELKY